MARIFSFRGKSIEELQALSFNDFAKLVKSRSRRALMRATPDYKELIKQAEKAKKDSSKKVIKTRLREAVILPAWVDMKFGVHNGKEYKEVYIIPDMVGHRLGEFSYSTKRVMHSAPGIRATRGSKFLAVK